MLYWVLILLAGLVAIPLVQELTRSSVASKQKDAPGQFAPLRKGKRHYRGFGPERGPVAV